MAECSAVAALKAIMAIPAPVGDEYADAVWAAIPDRFGFDCARRAEVEPTGAERCSWCRGDRVYAHENPATGERNAVKCPHCKGLGVEPRRLAKNEEQR